MMNNGNSLWFKKLLSLIAERFATKTNLNNKADKTDLISKNSTISLNTLGNRWVRLARFATSVRGATTINLFTQGSGGHLSAYKLTFFPAAGYNNGNLIIEGVASANYYAVKKIRMVRKGGAYVYLDAYIEPIATATIFTFLLGVSNELKKSDGINGVTLFDADVDVTIPEGYDIKEYVLNNKSNAWIQADLHGNADTATKATQDESGNNIVNTYATKEALGSVNQSIAGLTSGVNSKLEKNGSNASSTTTYNVLNAAAGGGNAEITDDEEIILTFPNGSTAYKRTLKKFVDYLRAKLIRDSFSPPTSNNIAPTVGAVTTVIENKEKNLKETYFDAAPISINKDIETAILEIPYSSAPDLYQRIYELNISSNIAHQVNFKIIFCPAVNNSKSFTTNTRAYVLGFSNDTTRGLFRFCTTNSGVVLTCQYTSDNSSSSTRQIAISINVARGTGFTKVNKPIADYGTPISSFYLTDTTYAKSYVTSDELSNTINQYKGASSDASGYASLPIVCKPSVYSAETTKSASEWISSCIPSSMITNGRSFIIVNPSNVTYKINGLANSSTYSLNSKLSMIIVYYNNEYYRQTV